MSGGCCTVLTPHGQRYVSKRVMATGMERTCSRPVSDTPISKRGGSSTRGSQETGSLVPATHFWGCLDRNEWLITEEKYNKG
jgi:hypothetical protein